MSPYLEDGAALGYIFSEESWGSAGPFGGPFLSRLCVLSGKIFLYPRAGYVPKVPSSVPRPVVLQAFCPPPFREPDQEKLNCMCPVRTLDAYVYRTALWRKTDQLLVCYGPPKKGLPAAKQTLSRWIVDAVILSYESSDLPSPLGVKAHSTRGMAASKAFLAGVPIQDICDAAGWSTPLTFVRFYDLDLQATPGSSVLERDAASQGHTSGIPTRATLHSWKLTPAAHHVLLSILVMTSPGPDVWPSILTDYTYDSELDIADGVPRSVSTQRLIPSGNHGYI